MRPLISGVVVGALLALNWKSLETRKNARAALLALLAAAAAVAITTWVGVGQ